MAKAIMVDLLTDNTRLLPDHISILMGTILMLNSVVGGMIGIAKRNDLRQWLSCNQLAVTYERYVLATLVMFTIKESSQKECL